MPGSNRPTGGWRFDFNGICLNDAPDAISPKQYPLAINVRAIQNQVIQTRPGYTILSNPFLIVTVCPIAQGILGIAYSYQLEASGGVAPYTWAIIAGALPTGLTLNTSTGIISGTPTVAGDFEWTAQAADALGNLSAPLECSLEIQETLAITSGCPADSPLIDVAYEFQMESTGGTLPVTWALTSGAFPTGISINASTGLISGTTSETGTFDWTVTATDSDAPPNVASIECSFEVVNEGASCAIGEFLSRPTTVNLNPAPGSGIRGTIDDEALAIDNNLDTYAVLETTGGTPFSTFAMAHYATLSPPIVTTGLTGVYCYVRRQTGEGNPANPAKGGLPLAWIDIFDGENTNADLHGFGFTQIGTDGAWEILRCALSPAQFTGMADPTVRFYQEFRFSNSFGNYIAPYPYYWVAEIWFCAAY